MEATKKCAGCGQVKPLSEFNRNRRNKDGLQDRCRQCFSEYNRRRYASDPERFKASARKRRDQHPESDLETRLRACGKNPSKKNAQMAIDAALRCGALVKPDVCYGCGKPATGRHLDAHHHDYGKPLEVVWLCKKCHRALDGNRRVEEGLPRRGNEVAVEKIDDGGNVVAVYESIVEAARAVGRSPSTISQAVSIPCRAAGFRWRRAEERPRA